MPRGLILDLVHTPEVQRLRRIRQLGVGYLTFPGAEHTRFGHALGAMALMHDTLLHLRETGTPISDEEFEAALAAALLHDIGHAPFSHTLEQVLIQGFSHEQMSRLLMQKLNHRLGGALNLTLAIFDNTYHRPFLHQLVSSQLDMDRLDYLRRDSFYTGVSEGKVGVARIIKTLLVHPQEGGPDARLVVQEKGIYAVENFLIARRLMYWQVYLHKTVLAGDHVLRSIFERARTLLQHNQQICPPETTASEALCFFLKSHWSYRDIEQPELQAHFLHLDDSDILFSLKQWMYSNDPVLSDLSKRFIHRNLFRVHFLDASPSETQLEDWKHQIRKWLIAQNLASSPQEAEALIPYYFCTDHSYLSTYHPVEEPIYILDRHGDIRELTQMVDAQAISALTRMVTKPYICYPKEVSLAILP